MRPSRRQALAIGAGALGLGGASLLWSHRSRAAESRIALTIRAEPIPALLPSDPEKRRFGDLVFRSGMVMTSDERSFGGLSALWRSPDGERLVSLTDHGSWLTARLISADRRLAGLTNAEMAPMLGVSGPLSGPGMRTDAESLAIDDGIAYVGIEGTNTVLRFPSWARDAVGAIGEAIPVPAEVSALPKNKGLEALAVAPPGHPLAGAVIAISERARDGDDAPTRGFILTGPNQGAFDVARSDAYDITELAFLPSGEMLLLERHYSRARGVAARLKRIARDALVPGALVDGPVIFEADKSYAIDNMEGLAIHRDLSGATVVTMISDDNFSAAQRTILLEFELV